MLTIFFCLSHIWFIFINSVIHFIPVKDYGNKGSREYLIPYMNKNVSIFI